MEVKEALKKIEEINAVIQSSNQALFSGRRMALWGVMLLLIPIVGYTTQWLTFGHYFGSYQVAYTTFTNTFFYWGLAKLIGKIAPRTDKQFLHPLITKAFTIIRPIVFAIIGVVFVLSFTNQAEYIYPVVLILLGLMYSMFGKFSIPAISYIAWSFIACGLLHFYLLPAHIPNLGLYFLIYNGLGYLVMGFLLTKAEKAHAPRA